MVNWLKHSTNHDRAISTAEKYLLNNFNRLREIFYKTQPSSLMSNQWLIRTMFESGESTGNMCTACASEMETFAQRLFHERFQEKMRFGLCLSTNSHNSLYYFFDFLFIKLNHKKCFSFFNFPGIAAKQNILSFFAINYWFGDKAAQVKVSEQNNYLIGIWNYKIYQTA